MKKEYPLIPVRDETALAKYGFDATNAVQKRQDDIDGWEWETSCPQCGGENRMVISNGKYWCRQGCGYYGAISYLAYKRNIEFKVDPEAANRVSAEKERKKQERQEKLTRLNREKPWNAHNRALMKSQYHLDMLEADGITYQNVIDYQIGLHEAFRAKHPVEQTLVTVPAITFPHFKGGTCVNIRCRILHPDFTKDKYRPYWSNLPYAFFATFGPEDRYCLFVEGEKKAIVLRNHGIPSVGLWGIHGIKDAWVSWFERRFDRRYLLYDSDSTKVLLIAYAQAKRLNAEAIFLEGKPDDMLLSGEVTPEYIKHIMKED